MNKLFEEYDDTYPNNNAYDVRYCESFNIQSDSIGIILTPGFYVKCEIFKWLNIINNILNNVLFLFYFISISICMIQHSNKVIKKKIALNSPHLADTIKFKKKLNKMIITNGILFLIAHIPEFVVTLIVLFRSSHDFVEFCLLGFDCNHLVEMAQAFHFISIGFQFFIFLTFDNNFRKSLFDNVRKSKQ